MNLSNDLANNDSDSHSLTRFLILVATATEEKIIHYSTIARVRGLPVQFRRLNEIVDAFHSASEDTGDRRENTYQKSGEIEEVITMCRQAGSSYERVLQNKCAEWRIPYNPDHMFFAAEDSTFSMEKPVWEILHNKLLPYVPPALLISAGKNGQDAGPGAETGPILAAVGVTRFFNLIREAALESNPDENKIHVKDHVTCVLTRLSDPPGAPSILLESEVLLQLYTPGDLQEVFVEPAIPITLTSHFLSTPQMPDVPLASHWDSFLLHASARAKIVDAFMNEIVLKASADNGLKLAGADVEITARRRRRIRQNYAVSQFGVGELSKKSTKIGSFPLKKRVSSFEDTASITYDTEASIREADAFIFPPFDASNPVIKRFNYHRLLRAIVAKQLEAHHMYKTIILMDNECWTPAVNLCFELANQGMSKDFIRIPLYEKKHPIVTSSEVEHIATCYFDVVRGQDIVKLERAAGQVLNYRRENYHRFSSPTSLPVDTRRGGVPPPEDQCTVAFFVSASSDNQRLIANAGGAGKFLAKNEYPAVWGAGD